MAVADPREPTLGRRPSGGDPRETTAGSDPREATLGRRRQELTLGRRPSGDDGGSRPSGGDGGCRPSGGDPRETTAGADPREVTLGRRPSGGDGGSRPSGADSREVTLRRRPSVDDGGSRPSRDDGGSRPSRDEEASQYDRVKQAILWCLHITGETHRVRFREYLRTLETHPRVVAQRLCDHMVHWLCPREKTGVQMGEAIALEQFCHVVGAKTQAWIWRHNLATLEATIRLAEDFEDSLISSPISLMEPSLTTEQQGTGSTSTITPHHMGIQTSQITKHNGQPNLSTMEAMAGPQLG
ncbi:UNVERIFIED_CONTAM: hypothetical protein FKN15_004003 [Acipenser sinensis]